MERKCGVLLSASKEEGDEERQVEAIIHAMLWYRLSISQAKPIGSWARRISRELSSVSSH